MKLRPGVMALALLLPLAVTGGASAADAPPGSAQMGLGQPGAEAALAARLAAQVRAIAGESSVSRAKKEIRIASAVRIAVVAATAYHQDPDEILGLATNLASVAAAAAPAYAAAISNAVAFTPSVARIEGATGQVRAAAYSAARGRRLRQEMPALAPARPPPNEEIASDGLAAPPVPSYAASARAPIEIPPSEPAARRPLIGGSGNVGLHVTADVSARYDNNVYLGQTNKVGDTVESVAPGVELHYGQNSLAHGSVVYKEAFTRYAHKSAANANLGTGNADIAYSDDRLNLSAAAAYQELYQTNAETLTLGQHLLYRSNILNLAGSGEALLTGKTSASVGVNYTNTEYKTPGFVSGDYLQWPAKLYFKATPKVDLSTGVTYGLERPRGGGPEGKDWFYNVGARGDFTPKLSGEFSVGYETRQVAANPRDHILAFDGGFKYAATAKTNCTLDFSRSFTASALGQSLKNSQYTFGVATQISPQWQVAANVAYRDVDYGSAVFTLGNLSSALHRVDHYWESGLVTSYLFSDWLSGTASYTFRKNHSSLAGLDFDDDLLALLLALRY